MPPNQPDRATQRIQFTQFRATDDSDLTKKFSLDATGTIQKVSQAQFRRGVAWKRSITSIHELPDLLDELEPTDCISTGIFDAPKVRVVPRNSQEEADGNLPLRHRTGEALRQPTPGLILLDHDPTPRMPGHLRCASAAELIERLAAGIPAFRNLSWVGRGSSSQGVYDRKTGVPYPGASGLHVYIAANVADLDAFREDLEVALWQAGFGYIELARNGRRLPRTIIDLSVLSRERLIFEAAPTLGPGIGRRTPEWEHSND